VSFVHVSPTKKTGAKSNDRSPNLSADLVGNILMIARSLSKRLVDLYRLRT
jgi:hypothetical protein